MMIKHAFVTVLVLSSSQAMADKDEAIRQTAELAQKWTAKVEEMCGSKITLDIDQKSFEQAAEADPEVWDWYSNCAHYLEGMFVTCRNRKAFDSPAGVKMMKTVKAVSCRWDPSIPKRDAPGTVRGGAPNAGGPKKKAPMPKLYSGARIALDKHTVQISFNDGASNRESALMDFLWETFFSGK